MLLRRATNPLEAARPTRVLFVCVHNAGRSQMAAAFLERLGGRDVDVRSAGTAPAGSVHEVVVEAMREVGIDLATATPKPLSDAAVEDADVVVTMGCGDACPFRPGKRYEEWELPDPTGRSLDEVRVIRDEIRERVREFLESIR